MVELQTRASIVENPQREILGYEPKFDIKAYRQATLSELSQLNTRTRHNLETMLGERFNVEISRVSYLVEAGQIKNPDHSEPFLEVVKRGQQYRLQLGSPDTQRETAEVLGFAKVQEILTDPHQADSKAIVISPRGNQNSIYQHNFFDVWEMPEPGQILMSRFTCKFSLDQFSQAAAKVDPFADLPTNPTDADFLKNPLVTYRDVGEIQQVFHPQEDTMPLREYQKLLEACAPLIESYIQALVDNSTAAQIGQIYNAILNYADDVAETTQNKTPPKLYESGALRVERPWQREIDLAAAITFYGNQPVRQVAAACGVQKGATTSSPFSVAEYGLAGEDQYGTLEIHCDECNKTYSRNPGKLEARCRFCGGTRGIVC